MIRIITSYTIDTMNGKNIVFVNPENGYGTEITDEKACEKCFRRRARLGPTKNCGFCGHQHACIPGKKADPAKISSTLDMDSFERMCNQLD